MKQCRACGEMKTIDEFYKRPDTADRHFFECKPCLLLERRSRRRVSDVQQELDRKHNADPRQKERARAKARRYALEHPERIRAYGKLQRGVVSLRVARPSSCPICGSTSRIVGHHADYSKPLDVTWMCSRCHARMHLATDKTPILKAERVAAP